MANSYYMTNAERVANLKRRIKALKDKKRSREKTLERHAITDARDQEEIEILEERIKKLKEEN